MSMLNSFSNSITSSTMSRLSAPRSSMKLASAVSFSRSTPSSFSMMSLTFSELSAMRSSVRSLGWCGNVTTRAAQRYGQGEPWEPGGAQGSGRCGYMTLHDHAAVHDEDLPGDVAGLVRSEEGDDAGDVGGAAHPAERDRGAHRAARFLGHGGGHVG